MLPETSMTRIVAVTDSGVGGCPAAFATKSWLVRLVAARVTDLEAGANE
jgi:hypothetical protein